MGSPPTSPGPAPFRGVQPPPGTPLPGCVALAGRPPVSEPQFPLSRGVRAGPRGCGKHGARCLAVSRSGQETLPGSGVASPPRTLSGDLGQGRYPLWASAAHLRREEESAVRTRPVVPAGCCMCSFPGRLRVSGWRGLAARGLMDFIGSPSPHPLSPGSCSSGRGVPNCPGNAAIPLDRCTPAHCPSTAAGASPHPRSPPRLHPAGARSLKVCQVLRPKERLPRRPASVLWLPGQPPVLA